MQFQASHDKIIHYFTAGPITNTNESNSSVVIGSSGGNISCIATGLPIPTITWTDINQSLTAFTQNDVLTEIGYEIGNVNIPTEGIIESILLIVNPRYPDDEQDYVCTAENNYGTSSVTITVEILGNTFIIVM